MISGVAVLFDTRLAILLVMLHIGLSWGLFHFFVRKNWGPWWFSLLATIGSLVVSALIAGLWLYYRGNGVIHDLELFHYYR